MANEWQSAKVKIANFWFSASNNINKHQSEYKRMEKYRRWNEKKRDRRLDLKRERLNFSCHSHRVSCHSMGTIPWRLASLYILFLLLLFFGFGFCLVFIHINFLLLNRVLCTHGAYIVYHIFFNGKMVRIYYTCYNCTFYRILLHEWFTLNDKFFWNYVN